MAKVSSLDGGSNNHLTAGGEGSDYIYSKYTKTNKKLYDTVVKNKIISVEQSTNIARADMSKVEEQFLALWKNETGQIGDTPYKADGIKVKYDDIYEKQTYVGDMFESAPEMLFEILEISEETRGLVDIFKYIMYKYTGVDYGITEESQIGYIFNMNAYYTADYNINTAMSPAELVLTKEQLEDAIKNTYDGQIEQNLLSCVDDFIYIQETNHINAAYAIAVAVQETRAGTDWSTVDSSTNNLYGIQGEYNGNSVNGFRQYANFSEATRDFGEYSRSQTEFTVNSIASANNNTEWGTSMIAEMTKIYNSIGIAGTTGIIEGVDGSKTFVTGEREYKLYTQKVEAYKSIPLGAYESAFPKTNLNISGCAIVSDTIVASGFGCTKTPIEVNNMRTDDHLYILKTLTGRNWVVVQPFDKEGALNELRKGNPIIIKAQGNAGFFVANPKHFAPILAINEANQTVFVADPGRTDGGKWWPISCFDTHRSAFLNYKKLGDS